MKLIVGLGNPGAQYAYTRHNFGFLVVEALLKDGKLSKSSLLMPATFMNNSGIAVKAIASKKGVVPQDILVVCDDLSLPFGQMRVRPSGSAGGHNGLKSIIEHLGTNEFPRLRLGIGRPKPGAEQVDYVLTNFTSGERKILPDLISTSLQCVYCWVNDGVESAMNQFNKRKTDE